MVVEAGSHLEIGKDAIKRLRDREELAGTGILICVDVTRVAGLDVQMGADDFILMPLAVDELAARLRQLKWRGTAQNPAGRSRYGEIILDTTSLQAFSAGQSLKLTPYEFQLLKFLVERAGRVFTREELLSRVWGYRHVGRVRTVDTHILNLRGKLGAAGELLEAVRGMGYKLRKLENQQAKAPRAARQFQSRRASAARKVRPPRLSLPRAGPRESRPRSARTGPGSRSGGSSPSSPACRRG